MDLDSPGWEQKDRGIGPLLGLIAIAVLGPFACHHEENRIYEQAKEKNLYPGERITLIKQNSDTLAQYQSYGESVFDHEHKIVSFTEALSRNRIDIILPKDVILSVRDCTCAAPELKKD